VPNWKEFRFKIEGEVNGVEMTPFTLPMSRLALYLIDLAQLLGFRESVHLIAVETGSTQPVIYVDAEEESRVVERVRYAQRGMGPRDANRAYKKIDSKLREDQAIATITNVTRSAEVIEFPGRKTVLSQPYGPIKERASLVGVVMRIGGFDKTVPVHLQRADGAIFYCDADPMVAQQLAPFYQRTIRIHGVATYRRGKEGIWTLDYFKIQSFDPQPLNEDNFSQTIAKLKAIPDNGWNDVADPLAELQKIRHGEENATP
jgi:hypothetical protein